MHDRLSPAIEALQEQLQKQLDEAAETKKAINALCRAMGKEPMYRDVTPELATGATLRRDRYYGRPLATVAQEFLESRKDTCSPDEIFEGLKAGAFDFKSMGWGGDEKDWIRNLSISLAKNTRAFHRLPNGRFGLVAWYPEISAKRDRDAAKAEKTKTDNGDAASEAVATTEEKK
jgi:hypothetical protein